MSAAFSLESFEKKHRSPLPALAELRQALTGLTPRHETGPKTPISDEITELDRLARRLIDRLEHGPEAPLLAAFLGATGTGKSKIFNSLLKDRVSPSGFKRPTTISPIVRLAQNRLEYALRDEFFSGYEKRTAEEKPVSFRPSRPHELILSPGESGETEASTPPEGLMLMDTPDFDSVLEANRAAARDVFERAEAVVFVTDAVKYADQVAWEYLERIRARGKAAVLVVNRVKNPLSLEDYRKRLAEAGLERPVLSLPDRPSLGDDELLPPDEPALMALDEFLEKWAGPERGRLIMNEVQADWIELEEGLLGRLAPRLDEALDGLGSLRESLTAAEIKVKDQLGAGLAVTISGELKTSLINQIQSLFLRVDLLKYPRRVIAVPFSFLRDKVLAPLGLMEERSPGRASLDLEIDRLFEANCETMIAMVHEFNRLAGGFFSSALIGRGLTEHPEFTDLSFSNDLVRERYARVRRDLETWVSNRATELVKDLNLGEKMTFYLAQVVSLGLFISVQVHTGGGFSFFDGLLDSALAPILSKVTGHALSRDKVKKFEDDAAALHLEGCQKIVEDQARAYDAFLVEIEGGLKTAGSMKKLAGDLVRSFEVFR